MLKEYVLFPASLNTNVQNCTPSYSCGIVFSLANILFSPLKLIMFLKWMSLVPVMLYNSTTLIFLIELAHKDHMYREGRIW